MTAKPHRTETDGNSISRERIFILETHAAVLLLLLLLWIDLYVVLLFFFSSSGGAHVVGVEHSHRDLKKTNKKEGRDLFSTADRYIVSRTENGLVENTHTHAHTLL